MSFSPESAPSISRTDGTPLSIGSTPNSLIVTSNPPILDSFQPSNGYDVWGQERAILGPFQEILLNHYLENTSFTLATDEGAQIAWQTSMPEMASKHKYLVHGILSVSALHLAQSYEGKCKERENLHTIAADQVNRGLIPFRTELQNINEKNAAALFAHSTLTAVYFFRTSALDMLEARDSIATNSCTSPAKAVDDMIGSFLRVVAGLRGALTVLKPGWNWVVGGELASICTRKWWPKHRVPESARAQEEDGRLADLEKLWINPDRPYEEHFECLSTTLAHLRETFALVSLLTDPATACEHPQMKAPIPYSVDDTTVGLLRDRAAIFVWPTHWGREYIALGEQRNCEALVMMAHYAVLLGRIRNVWWIEGVGLNTVWAIAMALGREKWHLIEWPARALGLDLESGQELNSTRDGSIRSDPQMNGR